MGLKPFKPKLFKVSAVVQEEYELDKSATGKIEAINNLKINHLILIVNSIYYISAIVHTDTEFLIEETCQNKTS